ncbi:MAG: adenosylcobinamide-GDP ribazoletransferase [Angelakisella sp.]
MLRELVGSMALCFSMYSVLPMSKNHMEKGSMRYVFIFLPLVGLFIGAVEYLWYLTASTLSLSVLLYAALATVLPTLISGGIHLDGLMDSGDAIASYGDTEKRLQILKDPHVGAFGVIYCVVYHLAVLGLYAQLFESGTGGAALLLLFAISRAVSGLITIHWASAKSSGLKYLFGEGAQKTGVTVVLLAELAALFGLAAVLCGWTAIIMAAALALFYGWYYRFTKKNFCGLTGDLVGFSLCLAELILLALGVVGIY